MSEDFKNYDLLFEQIEAAGDKYLKGVKTVSGDFGLEEQQFTVRTEEDMRFFNKAKGRYLNLMCKAVLSRSRTVSDYVSVRLGERIGETIYSQIKKKKPLILAVGLGNAELVADSLGARVVKNLLITRGLPISAAENLGKLCAISPGVFGQTGIESFDIIKGVVSEIKPDVVLAVDTLCAADPQRLGCSFQLSTAGIVPGAGVRNARRGLNKENLGVPVVAVGVPLVVYSSTLCSGELSSAAQNTVVTPKDIDFYVKICSSILTSAINSTAHGDEYLKFL